MAGLAQNSFGLLNFKKIAFKIKEKSDCFSLCDPAGIRTQDPILKRDVLYQLSY